MTTPEFHGDAFVLRGARKGRALRDEGFARSTQFASTLRRPFVATPRAATQPMAVSKGEGAASKEQNHA